MSLFFKFEHQQLDGICVDSGQGKPESLSKYLGNLNLLSKFLCADSFSLCNIWSVLCLPMLSCIDSGGLDYCDEIQLLHTMYVFYIKNRSFWHSIMRQIAVKMGYTKATIPRHLERSMQAPLTTRW